LVIFDAKYYKPDMKRLFIILINMLLAYTAMAQQNIATVRNGQGLTEYVYPLNGDIESIERISVQTNLDTGKEYSTVSSTISFNENGDVTCISPYKDLRYSDVVFPAVLRFIYDNSGKNTKIIEEVYWDDKIAYCNEIVYTYNDKGQKIKGEGHNDKGEVWHTEEYIYDAHGKLIKETYTQHTERIIYTYDANMNITHVEEYHNDRLSCTTDRTFNEDGKIVKEVEFHSYTSGETRLVNTTTYCYDDNGFLQSSESVTPLSEEIRRIFKDPRTEQVIRTSFRCDTMGNVIEKNVAEPESRSGSDWKTVYNIKYRLAH
jgi:hypothetical protein